MATLLARLFREQRVFLAWNEFENESLQSATGNSGWQEKINAFWDIHFPVYISVRDGYEYAAISFEESSFGQVVSGGAPAYEETTAVTENYREFVKGLSL